MRSMGLASAQSAPTSRTTLGPNRYVLPSTGDLLQRYLAGEGQRWRCPSAPDTSFTFNGADAYGGRFAPDEFRPNYIYLSGKEFHQTAEGGGLIATTYKLREWAGRNVSGLRVASLRPIARERSSDIVLFHDRFSTYHSKGNRDTHIDPGTWDYFASYAYLDGHADGHAYAGVSEYLGNIHGAIPRRWFGKNFEQL